jgi:short-subunit dehydrogenase
LATGRNHERGESVVAEIKKARGKAEFIAADLLSLKEINRLTDEIKSRIESLDILINNAGDAFLPKRMSVDGIEAAHEQTSFPVGQFPGTRGRYSHTNAAKPPP